MGAPRRPLKVCHIAATTEGAIWVLEQLRELRDRYGYDVAAILSGDRGALVDKFHAAGIRILSANFDFTSNVDLLDLPRKVIGLARILRHERFDVVQTHLFHSMVIGRIAAWLSDVPVCYSMIAGPFHLEAYTPRWIDQYTRWIDTATIASCKFTHTLYVQMGAWQHQIPVIYYGPDPSKFDPSTTPATDIRAEFGWAADTPLIGMVAYFYPELPKSRWIPQHLWGRSVKSQEDLIRAAPLVLQQFPKAKFVLVGSGWEDGGRLYLERMKLLVAELALERDVIFTGFRSDVPSMLRALDVSVQPSLSENLGGTIESLLMQCPTVATQVGGMTDSVLNEKTGLLAKPSDPASLAGAIIRLLRDPAAARKYGVAGRELMLAKFTLAQTVADLSELYERSFSMPRDGYRPWATVLRLVLGVPFCSVVVLRYIWFDSWLLRHWDQGWRPWRLNALRILPIRIWLYRLYAFIGRHPTNFGIRRRLGPLIAAAKAPFSIPARMRLYQFYSFVGRQPTGFGIRKRVSRLIAKAKAPFLIPPRMRLYQFYSFIGRHPTNFGIRRRLRTLFSKGSFS